MKWRKKQKTNRRGDVEANIAYYCLLELKILPSEFANLSIQDKAFIFASARIHAKNMKEKQRRDEMATISTLFQLGDRMTKRL